MAINNNCLVCLTSFSPSLTQTVECVGCEGMCCDPPLSTVCDAVPLCSLLTFHTPPSNGNYALITHLHILTTPVVKKITVIKNCNFFHDNFLYVDI